MTGCQVNDVRCDLGGADIDGKPEPGCVDPADVHDVAAVERDACLPAPLAEPCAHGAYDFQIGQISVDAGGRVNCVVQTLVIGAQVFQAGGIHSHDALGNDRLEFDRHVETLDLGALECGQGLRRDMELDVAEREGAAGQ